MRRRRSASGQRRRTPVRTANPCMSGDGLRAHAERFVAAAIRHPQCRDARIARVTDNAASIELDLDVEMPLHMKADGVSESGVRRIETATVRLEPLLSVVVADLLSSCGFSPQFPHLQPGAAGRAAPAMPRRWKPAGIFLPVRPRRGGRLPPCAPTRTLASARRRGRADRPGTRMGADAAERSCRLPGLRRGKLPREVDREGGHRVLKSSYFRSGSLDTRPSNGATAFIEASMETVPLRAATRTFSQPAG